MGAPGCQPQGTLSVIHNEVLSDGEIGAGVLRRGFPSELTAPSKLTFVAAPACRQGVRPGERRWPVAQVLLETARASTGEILWREAPI